MNLYVCEWLSQRKPWHLVRELCSTLLSMEQLLAMKMPLLMRWGTPWTICPTSLILQVSLLFGWYYYRHCNVSLYILFAGFYYFIFSNENEITSNFVAANFEMHKTIFDVRSYEDSCDNSTDCSLHLSFFSPQHVVIEVTWVGKGDLSEYFVQVPQSDRVSCDYEAEGYTNYHQCNTIVSEFSI